MSKRAEEAAYNYAKENGTLGYDYNQIYDAAKHGYEQAEKDMIEKAAKWIRAHWREYIWGPDADGCIGFGLWENDFRKAMEEE